MKSGSLALVKYDVRVPENKKHSALWNLKVEDKLDEKIKWILVLP